VCECNAVRKNFKGPRLSQQSRTVYRDTKNNRMFPLIKMAVGHCSPELLDKLEVTGGEACASREGEEVRFKIRAVGSRGLGD
jgi:hypothetical protein